MIEHVWTVICSRSIIDQETNNISLFEVLEEINITGPPFPLPEGRVGGIPIAFEVITLWVRSNDDHPTRGRGRLQLSTPSGEVVNQNEYDIDLTFHQRTRARARVIGFPVLELGQHIFCVQLLDEEESQWRNIANIPLKISYRPSNEK